MKSSPSRLLPCLAALVLGPLASAQTYTFTSLGGEVGYGTVDGTGGAARFTNPGSLALDRSGNVFLIDNQTIRKIEPGGVVTTLAGAAGISGTIDGLGPAARFRDPAGLTVDAGGNVFVADSGNHAIRKITPDGSVTTFAGELSIFSPPLVDGIASAARFTSPVCIAVDASGNVFVGDYATIRKITPGGVVTTLAGAAGSYGAVDGVGSVARFNVALRSLAVDGSGNLYGLDSDMVRKITPAGVVTTLAGAVNIWGSADGAGRAAQFFVPRGIAVDRDGNVFVADSNNNTIRKVSAAGSVATLAGTAGTTGSTDGTGGSARFDHPLGIAVDSNGTVFVADSNNYVIRQITSDGMVTTLAGAKVGALSFGNQNVTGNRARVGSAAGLALAANGDIFVGDSAYNLIRKISAAGVLSTIAGQYNVLGEADGIGGAAQFSAPKGVAVDGSGNVFVAGFNTIRRINPDGVVTTLAGVFGASGGTDGPGNLARFSGPTGVATDRAGNLFVTDTGNQSIRRITPTGIVTTLAGSGSVGRDFLLRSIGQAGSADGSGSAARFNNPTGITVDGSGNVFVVDSGNLTIRKITPEGVVTTFAGQPGARGTADGTASSARFEFVAFDPPTLAADANGNLFVVDGLRIRNISAGGVVTTIAGQGGGSFNTGAVDGTGSAARFNGPTGIAVDARGDLIVADLRAIRKGTTQVTPLFAAQPKSVTIGLGNSAVLSAASIVEDVTYQWKRNGVVLVGATSATLVVGNAQAADNGSYVCEIANSSGTAASAAAILSVVATSDPGRLINMSIRANVGTGDSTLIVGVVIGGGAAGTAKPLLVRGIGPALAAFSVGGALVDPALTIFQGSTAVASNDNWAGDPNLAAVAARVGAFALASPGSRDAALYNPAMPAGNYTVQLTSVDRGAGVALAEIYDATPAGTVTASTPRLINVSARTQAGVGANTLIAGFTIGGTTARTVLIRGIGPALAQFSVGGALADPRLELYSGATRIQENDNWGGGTPLTGAFAMVGAFNLSAASRDAALFLTLEPGSYTAQVSSVNGATGIALVELYEMP